MSNKKSSNKNYKSSSNFGPQLALIFMFFVLTIGISGAGLYFFTYVPLVMEQQKQTTEELLARTTSAIDKQFTRIKQELNGASHNTALHAALQENNLDSIQSIEKILAKQLSFPGTLSIHTSTIATANIDGSFSERSLIERTRHNDKPLPIEIIPGKNKTLLYAVAVKNGTSLLGTILLKMPIGNFLTTLDIASIPNRKLTISQTINKQTNIIYQHDSLTQSSGYTSYTGKTKNRSIAVVLTANKPLLHEQPNILLSFTILVAACLVNILILLTVHRKMQQTLETDAALLTHAIQKLIRQGKLNHIKGFKLDIFRSLAYTFAQIRRSEDKQVTLKNVKSAKKTTATPPASISILDETISTTVPAEIFREYDIRGIVNETLTPDLVKLIGQAIGSEALAQGEDTVIIARDGRLSGPSLSKALTEGITSSGANVINIGAAPTPVLYFATKTLNSKSGVCLTGSHNPSNYNGLKIVIADQTLYGDGIQALRQRINNNDLANGQGKVSELDINQAYIDYIVKDISISKPLKVVLDAGNGIAGAIAPALFEKLGCTVETLFCEVDGSFPNHHPDPSKAANLADLVEKVKSTHADIGIAFDGDGDRIGVVTPQGNIIYSDRLMMLYAKDILMRAPGSDIIFDVKCSRELANVISKNSGNPIMWKTGHSLVKAKLRETKAALAGEMSGHIFFNDRWFGFDDALYSGARLLEILALLPIDADHAFDQFPELCSTPELAINVKEENKFHIIKELVTNAEFGSGKIIDIDGLRVEFSKGWGLVRASNTTPTLVARFEAETEGELQAIQQQFRQQLLFIDPDLELPF